MGAGEAELLMAEMGLVFQEIKREECLPNSLSLERVSHFFNN